VWLGICVSLIRVTVAFDAAEGMTYMPRHSRSGGRRWVTPELTTAVSAALAALAATSMAVTARIEPGTAPVVPTAIVCEVNAVKVPMPLHYLVEEPATAGSLTSTTSATVRP
jgi:hypothetical protein